MDVTVFMSESKNLENTRSLICDEVKKGLTGRKREEEKECLKHLGVLDGPCQLKYWVIGTSYRGPDS